MYEEPRDNDSWQCSFSQGLFNTTTDSKLFFSIESLKETSVPINGNQFQLGTDKYYPIYEGKMIQSFDHRYANSLAPDTGAKTRGKSEHLSDYEKSDPCKVVFSRHYVHETDCLKKVPSSWKNKWFLGWRAVGGAVANMRTLVCSLVPFGGVADKIFLMYPLSDPSVSTLLLSSMNCYVVDYCVRQKISGITLNYFIIKQLPLFKADYFFKACPWSNNKARNIQDWLLIRLIELYYTAWDLEPFAKDCGWDGPPFRWDEERRFLLRCELDAAFFYLYLPSTKEGSWKPAKISEGAIHDETPEQLAELTKHFPAPRDAVSYIMETFPIVKKRDETEYGSYRTKDTILEIYDAMQTAIATGEPYQTKLNPPPGPPVDENGAFLPYALVAKNPPRNLHLPREGAPASLERELSDLSGDFPSQEFRLRTETEAGSLVLKVTPLTGAEVQTGEFVVIAHPELKYGDRQIAAAAGTITISARTDATSGEPFLSVSIRGDSGISELKIKPEDWNALRTVGRANAVD